MECVTFIALTGGIAAGKTTIARRFAELGAVVLDADAQARDVVIPGAPALEQIRKRFGDAMISADGSLDRAALGTIVFSDAQARKDLEAITHPAIREQVFARVASARRADPEAIIIYDVPLLVEAARPVRFDAVIVAHAPRKVRRQRLIDLRGLTPEEADQRLAAQATDEERLAVATHVIPTDVPLEDTLAAVDLLWDELRGTA